LTQLNSSYSLVFADLDRRIQIEDEQTAEETAQYKDYLEFEKKEQVRAAGTMALLMTGALIETFLNHARAGLDRSHRPKNGRYGSKKDSWLLRREKEYKERFHIDLAAIEGFQAIKEVTLREELLPS
jgi:hypothetical protein